MSKTGCPSTTVPSICIPPWAGGTVAIVVGACDLGGHPPTFAPRSTRTKNGINTHFEQKHLFLMHLLILTSFSCRLSSLATVLSSLSLLISSSLLSVLFASTSCFSFIRPSFRLNLFFCCFCFPLFLCCYHGLCLCIRRCCFALGTSFSVCLCFRCFISYCFCSAAAASVFRLTLHSSS